MNKANSQPGQKTTPFAIRFVLHGEEWSWADFYDLVQVLRLHGISLRNFREVLKPKLELAAAVERASIKRT